MDSLMEDTCDPYSYLLHPSQSSSPLPKSPPPKSPPQVPLPPAVEQLISRICSEQKQPPLGVLARQRLASLGEENAVAILRDISRSSINKSFDGFVHYLANKQSAATTTTPDGSPDKRPRLSPQRLIGSPGLAPTLHMMNTQGGSPAQSPIPAKLQGLGSNSFAAISLQLEALGELEFRKAFLILSYLGGKDLVEVISADEIRALKHLMMEKFEAEVWKNIGCRCGSIKEHDRPKFRDGDSGKTHIYQCHVSPDLSFRFKGPYLTNTSNFLQRALGDENVLMVKFAEEMSNERTSLNNTLDYYYSTYKAVMREGILVGSRRYHFFVFKDGGKEEKKKDPTTSPVKCFFVRMESDSSSDTPNYILNGKTVREARSIFMHVDTLNSLAKYMARFSLILSKTMNLEVDLSTISIETVEDIRCQDKDGKGVFDKEGKPSILTDGTGFISEDLALKCPKNVCKGKCKNANDIERIVDCAKLKEKFPVSESLQGEPPLLIQFRLFNKGSAVKGTFLVSKKLPPKTIRVRPSMIKVQTDEKLLSTDTKDSLEIVGTSNRPKKAFLSKTLIALLNHGGVPKEVFMDILNNALEDANSALTTKRAALRVALNYGEMDDFSVVRMILSGIPLEESFLQYRLSILRKEEKKNLRSGKIPVAESYYLMGTVDPTGLLDEDEVCIILENGQVSGKVLVYRNPGLHFGDIHVLTATYVKAIEDFVGNEKYGIFFPSKGRRSVADEIAGGDYDGDMYFVSRNPQLLEKFRQSEPWTSSSLPTPIVPQKRPSEFSDQELEDELFKLFLKTRFQPSYTVGMAAESWLAIMDRFLTLGDDNVDEKANMKRNMECLIDLYYDALDAPKKGGEKIELDNELKAEFFPHYMEKKDEMSYKSTSILGLIYDKVKSIEEEPSKFEVWKLPCFTDEVPHSCLAKWEKLYNEYRLEMKSALTSCKETKDEAANEVLKKYKEILYEAAEFEESKRSERDVFNEACAIYNVAYDYAKTSGVERCSFAWRVAGLALCKLYILAQKQNHMICSVSTLKEILG